MVDLGQRFIWFVNNEEDFLHLLGDVKQMECGHAIDIALKEIMIPLDEHLRLKNITKTTLW